jgi:heat-inducible transcriptional repressor
MDERKQLILEIIIQEHIKTGAPVGSGVVVEKYHLDVSAATVRNDMSWLEHEGFIAQPHTSAGRIPTEGAYQWFLNRVKAGKLKDISKGEIKALLKNKEEDDLKQVAKVLAQHSNNAIFWAFNPRNLYYTGISNLFAQPEFAQIEKVYDLSVVIDRMDEVIEDVFRQFDQGIHTIIGADNPFGAFCSTVLCKYKHKDGYSMFGVIGPMRMDYAKNISLVNLVNSQLS